MKKREVRRNYNITEYNNNFCVMLKYANWCNGHVIKTGNDYYRLTSFVGSYSVNRRQFPIYKLKKLNPKKPEIFNDKIIPEYRKCNQNKIYPEPSDQNPFNTMGSDLKSKNNKSNNPTKTKKPVKSTKKHVNNMELITIPNAGSFWREKHNTDPNSYDLIAGGDIS